MDQSEMVRVLMENPLPQHPMVPAGPPARDGGDEGGAMFWQEENMMMKTAERLNQGMDHLFDGDLDERGGVIGVDDLHAGRKYFSSSAIWP